MKRIALAIAAAALGTGCIVHNDNSTPSPPPNTGSVDFGWTFVRTKADNTTVAYGCALAGVDNVIVSFPAGDVQVACADQAGDGALITGVAPGTQNVFVTGRRGGTALYASQTTVTVTTGQTTSAPVAVYGIPDDLSVYANFRRWDGVDVGWSTCALANVATLSYTLVDWANTVVATGTVSCTNPAGVSFLGAGALDRDNYAVRMLGFPSGSQVETFDSATTAVSPTCSGQDFNHYGADVGAYAWDVILYDVHLNGTLCP